MNTKDTRATRLMRSVQVHTRAPPKLGEWPTYGGKLASTRYAALDQITQDNFNKLEVAWRFKTDAMGPRPELNLQLTPLFGNGRMYSTAGTRRSAIALDPATGELLWKLRLTKE